MPKRKKRDKKMTDGLYHAVDAMNDAADDMPDGAWWAVLEDSVTEYNRHNGTKYDPFDMVHEYLNRKHEEQEKVKHDEESKANG